jgi:hypothetical protein
MKIYLKLAEVPGIAREILMGKNRFLKIPNFKAEVPGDARGIKKKSNYQERNSNFLLYVTPEVPMSFPNKFQLIWSSRSVSHSQHIYIKIYMFTFYQRALYFEFFFQRKNHFSVL